jgi:hypothetical protein
MNKTIAMLIPTVVLFAMALIVLNHFSSGDEKSAPVEGPSVQAPMQTPGQAPGPGQPLPAQPGQPGMPYFEQGGQGALAPGQPGGTMTEPPAGMVSPGEGEPAGSPGSAGQAGQAASGEPRTALGRMASKSGADLAAPLESKKKEPAKGTEKAAPAKPAEKAAPVPVKGEKAEKAAPATAAKPQATAPAKAAPAATPQTAKGDHSITSATIKFSGSTAILHLQGDAPIQYKYIVLPNPDRLALDLTGAWSVTAPSVPSNRVIEKVRVGRYGENTRIVLDLKAAPTKHEVVKSGDRVIEVRVQ